MSTSSAENVQVSVIIPVYNEENGLAAFLQEYRAFVQQCTYRVETLLVNDGSTDGTATILHQQEFPVHTHQVNLGYGAAIKTGIQHTAAPCVVILDCDGTYNPAQIQELVDRLSDVDMVVGARLGKEAQIPWVRRPAKWMIKCFAEWLVHRQIPDLNSGLRAMKRSAVKPIFRLLPDGFSLTTTITTAFHALGKRVDYYPIEYRRRSGKSKFHPIHDTWNMILVILRTVVLFRPLNFFLPLSFLLAFVGIVVGLGTKLSGEFMDATFIVLMMTSIQMFVLGLIADLIVRLQFWTH